MKLSIGSTLLISATLSPAAESHSLSDSQTNHLPVRGILHKHIASAADAAHTAKLSDRRLQQNPCGYVNIQELEETYKAIGGVDFTCSCKAFGYSNSAQTTCSSNEPYCCVSEDNGDGQSLPDCRTVKEEAGFTVVPFSGYFVPVPTAAQYCMTFTDGLRDGKTVCRATEFESCVFQEKRSACTCEVTFDGSKCGECTPCVNGDGGAYDCSNVQGSFGHRGTCEDADETKHSCFAQSSGTPTAAPAAGAPLPPPTPRPTSEPTSIHVPASVPEQAEVSPVSQPSEPAPTKDGTSDKSISSTIKPFVNIRGPQSLQCTDGYCSMDDELTAQKCNFYALTKYGETSFNDKEATVKKLNTIDGPIAIEEGCKMKCSGCSLVLSSDASPGDDEAFYVSSGFGIGIHSLVMISSAAVGALHVLYR